MQSRFMHMRAKGKAGHSLDRVTNSTTIQAPRQAAESKMSLKYNSASIPYIQKQRPQRTQQANNMGSPLQNQRFNSFMPDI